MAISRERYEEEITKRLSQAESDPSSYLELANTKLNDLLIEPNLDKVISGCVVHGKRLANLQKELIAMDAITESIQIAEALHRLACITAALLQKQEAQRN